MSSECCGGTPTEGKKCCPCKRMPGLFVILIGLTFLLKQVGVIDAHTAGILWPVIVILAGAQLMFRDLCKCCRADTGKGECCSSESK